MARSRLRNPELLRLLRGREYDLVYQALLTVLAKIDVTTAMRQRFMEMIMGDEGMRSRMEANRQAGTAALCHSPFAGALAAPPYMEWPCLQDAAAKVAARPITLI